MKPLPGIYALRHNYPSYAQLPSVRFKAMVGGTAGGQGDPDTCALRMSWTLNKCGYPIPARFAGAYILPGRDLHEYYMLRISDLIKYLTAEYCTPLSAKSTTGWSKPPQGFRAAGIICFWWGAAGSANGHIDVWDGSTRAGDPALITPGAGAFDRSTLHRPGQPVESFTDHYWHNAREIYLWPAGKAVPAPVR